MGIFDDIATELWLRLRLFFKDKATVAVLVVSLVFFFFAMGQLNDGAEERAGIPVGVAAGEDTVMARALVERLCGLESLYVEEGSFQELYERFDKGYLSCIFEIREGYEERVSRGNYRNLITVYHGEEEGISSVLADIVAGEMMYEICLAQGYAEYKALPDGEKEKYTRKEYEEYVDSLAGNGAFDFAFQFRFLDTEGKKREEGVKNSLFYRQAITAVAAMLLAMIPFAAMSGLHSERAQGIAARKTLTAMGKAAAAAGDLLAAVVLSFGMSVVFAVCACFGAGKEEKFFAMLWTTLAFSIIMALTYYLLAKIWKGILGFQTAGTVLLLVMGGCGFCSLVEGALIGSFPGWFHWIPNCVFLRSVTRLLV